MKAKKERIQILDELRGFAILAMVVHHFFLDVYVVLGADWGLKIFNDLCVVQPLFWAIFIIISGICSRLSRNTVRRGIIVFCGGLIITFVTAVIMPKFGYDEDKIIIKDFSANIKAGSKVAIVGPTGAGKTTMVNLLMKFYNINSGDIKIDNISIKDLTRENIHDLFVMVLQDTWLFKGTIKDNIRFNRDNKDEYYKVIDNINYDKDDIKKYCK